MAGHQFIYLFIKNICVCNAQLMQKAQQRRYKTVAAIWTKKFSIPSENSWTRESVLLELGGREFHSPPPGPATAKARGPNVTVRVLGTSSSNLSADRRCCRPRVCSPLQGRKDTNRADICRPWSPAWRRFFDELEASANLEEQVWYDRISVCPWQV